MSRRLVAIAAAVLACAIPFAASAALSKVGTPAVTIGAVLKGPGDTKVGDFKGRSSALSVADDGKELKFSVPISSIKTDNEDRDADMVARFSKGSVVLTVPRDKVKFPTDKSTSGTVRGTVTLNGESSDVSVKYEAEKTNGEIAVTADFVFDYQKHHNYDGEKGGKACKLKVVCVDPKLSVAVNAKFKE